MFYKRCEVNRFYFNDPISNYDIEIQRLWDILHNPHYSYQMDKPLLLTKQYICTIMFRVK